MPELLECASSEIVSVSRADASRPAFREFPFWIAAALYAVTTGVIFAVAWHVCGGHFVYPLDDVYINMAVAKTFAIHGVWGVSPFEFNSTTSSPLYVLLLSGVYRLVGVNRYAPAVLSWVFGLAALYVGTGLARRHLRPTWQAVTMIGVVLLTPMFLLGTLGMEHALHVLAVLGFLAVFQSEERPLWVVALATVLMCAARYEGLLMAAAAAGVLLFERKWLRAAIIAATAWIPVGCYAWFSLAHGGAWLPNSVLLKGLDGAGMGLLGKLTILGKSTLINVMRAPHTALMSVAMLMLVVPVWKAKPRLGGLLATVGAAGVLHLMLAAVGWAFRYEAYLVAAGVIVIACTWPEIRQSKSTVVLCAQVLCFLAFGVLVFRTAFCAASLPLYSRAVYEQQGQMARFLKTYYPDGSVAANDIGYISYETDIHCLDLAGLASAEVFNAKRTGQDTTEFLEKTAREHKVQVIILYESWFSNESHVKFGGPKPPASWEEAGRWSVPERLQLGDRTVTFFGTDAAGSELLRKRLAEFEPTLPKGVTVGR